MKARRRLIARFWWAFDWACLLIALIAAVPIFVAVAKHVMRAMSDQ